MYGKNFKTHFHQGVTFHMMQHKNLPFVNTCDFHLVEESRGGVLDRLALARGVPHPLPPAADIPAPSRLHLKKTHPNNTPLGALWVGCVAGITRAVDLLHPEARVYRNPLL